YLTQGSKARVKVFDFDFSTLEIKGRSAQGNILSRYPVRKIQLKMEGTSTLGGLDVYYDEHVGKLNTDQRGTHIGNFLGGDKIIVFYRDGSYELTGFDISNRYNAADLLLIEKFDPQKVVSAIYFDGASKNFYVKRFLIETSTMNKKFSFISDHKQSYLKLVSTEKQPQARVVLQKGKETVEAEYDLDMLIDVKGWKAVGNKVSNHFIKEIHLISSVKSQEEQNGQEDLEIGSTVDFKIKKGDEDQLGLF